MVAMRHLQTKSYVPYPCKAVVSRWTLPEVQQLNLSFLISFVHAAEERHVS